MRKGVPTRSGAGAGGIFRTAGAALAAGAVVLAGVGAGCDLTGGTRSGPSTGAPGTPAASPTVPSAAMGEPAKDENFTFIVTKLSRRKQVGDEFLGRHAQGVFVVVHLTVTSHSDKPRTFFPDDQRLLAGGRTYDADARAAAYLDDASRLYGEVGPGASVRGVLLFDIPDQATPEAVALHGSPRSAGVTVTLR